MQKVNFFLENLENYLWAEVMFFLPVEGDFISNNEGKWIVVGRIYVSNVGEWNIFLEEVE